MNEITWRMDPLRNFGIRKLSPLDILKLKSSYGCSDRPPAGECFLHLSEFDGVLSSTDPTYQGCQVLLTSLYGSVELITTKFKVKWSNLSNLNIFLFQTYPTMNWTEKGTHALMLSSGFSCSFKMSEIFVYLCKVAVSSMYFQVFGEYFFSTILLNFQN